MTADWLTRPVTHGPGNLWIFNLHSFTEVDDIQLDIKRIWFNNHPSPANSNVYEGGQ